MGAWFSSEDDDAPAIDTPAPVKIEGPEADTSPTQAVTRRRGARHAPAARSVYTRPATGEQPAPGRPMIWAVVEFPVFPRVTMKGARLLLVSTVIPLASARDDL